MLEDDDYRLISDQLYLLPFLRKYASFLDIDQDETAMRLLREVQRLDSSSAPVRLDEPLEEGRRHRRRNWSKPILFGGLIAVIIGAYIAQLRHSQTELTNPPTSHSPQAAAVSTPSAASKESLTAGPQSSMPRDEQSHFGAPHPPTAAMATSNREATQVPVQERVTPTDMIQPPSESQRNNRGSGQLTNH
jgi:cytoskeletal protein RodZ